MIEETKNTLRIERVEEILADQLERRTDTMLERHAQTVIVFVILAVLSWVGYSIIQTGEAINRTNVSIEVLKTDVKYMKTALDNAASTHVNVIEYRISNGQLQKDIAETKARLRLLENNTGETPKN